MISTWASWAGSVNWASWGHWDSMGKDRDDWVGPKQRSKQEIVFVNFGC
jgi:hypothetical protein